MTEAPDHDVLIVGAGPAGSQLALRLARAGWNVGLLDKHRFPRPKPCGEFMSPECLPLLDELGVRDEVAALGARKLRGMRIHGFGRSAGGDYASLAPRRSLYVHGYAVRREQLDALLYREARAEPGVTVYEAHAVSALLRDGDGRVVGVRAARDRRDPVEVRARWTVGADGRQSVVARELGARSFARRHQRYAVVARFRDVAPSERGEVHVLRNGYFAAAPVEDRYFTVNLVVPRVPGGHAEVEAFLRRRLDEAPQLRSKIATATIDGPIRVCGPLAVRTSRQTFDGAALVGDACGFVDPLTGEGLFFAMKGAALLADALDAALRRGGTRAGDLAAYARARRREFRPRTALSRALQVAMRRPGLAAWTLGVLERHPIVMELLVGLTGDSIAPRDLLRPAFWSRALRRGSPHAALAAGPHRAPE